ncbi:hypothetical protein GCM10020331_061030 [Ectobacillus funiculus]
MKIKELIEQLQKKCLTKKLKFLVNHWLVATKSDKVIVSLSKVQDVVFPVDGKFNTITINTEKK